MDENSYKTLLAVARVVLHTRNGTHLRPDRTRRGGGACGAGRRRSWRGECAEPARSVGRRRAVSCTRADAAADGSGLQSWNGFGGFDRDGRDYVVRLGRPAHDAASVDQRHFQPSFGFHTSAEGASFTWSRNSRDFQLTPWSNDPVTNRPGEAFYVHDQASGKAFSPFAAVARDRLHELRGAARPGIFDLHRQARAADRWN